MKIFDSHCHLDDEAFEQDRDAVLKRAREADVRAMMTVGLGPGNCRKAIAIARKSEAVYVSVGIHPHDARTCREGTLAELRSLAADPKVRAWGEIGLDFNRMHSPRQVQEHCFARQLEIASELQLPVIFHERESRGRFLKILKAHWTAGRRGVIHCFSGSDCELAAYLEAGLFIGITGILTIRGRGHDLRQQVKSIPDDRLLVETDAPYLAPTPERNKFRRNEPAFVRTVLLKLADIRQVDPQRLAEITWENASRLFGLEMNSQGINR